MHHRLVNSLDVPDLNIEGTLVLKYVWLPKPVARAEGSDRMLQIIQAENGS